jgi:DNA-binding transcriptional MerR regulator
VVAYDLAEAAERSGIKVDELRRFVELGIVTPDGEGRFTPGALRRAGLVKALIEAGIPLDGLGAAMRSGQVSLGEVGPVELKGVSGAMHLYAARPAD